MKKLVTMIMILSMSLGMVFSGYASELPEETEEETTVGTIGEVAVVTADEWEDVFAEWNKDAPALNYLKEYVESVTDETSGDFIPVKDRIAVFDMDGTLYGEMFPTYLMLYTLAWRILKDPTFEPDEELLALGREIRESVITGSFADDISIRCAYGTARAFAGLTLTEYADFINSILLKDVDGFKGMTYGEAFYQPMIEVVEYLQDNDFTVYVVSGSDRFMCRTLLEGVIDIPYANIIGMDVAVEASGQNGTDGLNYVYSAGDNMIRTDSLIIYNVKMNKVSQIVQEIGQQPVLSFGNSSGDVSMHNYTIYNNEYKSAAFMLIADDEERDYGYAERTRTLGERWEGYGYHVISIREDFCTIYPEGVVRTGSFHWKNELSDER